MLAVPPLSARQTVSRKMGCHAERTHATTPSSRPGRSQILLADGWLFERAHTQNPVTPAHSMMETHQMLEDTPATAATMKAASGGDLREGPRRSITAPPLLYLGNCLLVGCVTYSPLPHRAKTFSRNTERVGYASLVLVC